MSTASSQISVNFQGGNCTVAEAMDAVVRLIQDNLNTSQAIMNIICDNCAESYEDCELQRELDFYQTMVKLRDDLWGSVEFITHFSKQMLHVADEIIGPAVTPIQKEWFKRHKEDRKLEMAAYKEKIKQIKYNPDAKPDSEMPAE